MSREEFLDLCVELAKTPIDERVEEQKYYVKFNNGYMLIRGWKNSLKDMIIDRPDNVLSEDDKNYYTFTEAQIKAIDPRYWAFAVPVEEEEN